MRFKVAEFRVWQAHHALEDAECRACSPSDLDELEAAYLREVATCKAAQLGVASPPVQWDNAGV